MASNSYDLVMNNIEYTDRNKITMDYDEEKQLKIFLYKSIQGAKW